MMQSCQSLKRRSSERWRRSTDTWEHEDEKKLGNDHLKKKGAKESIVVG